MPRPARPWFRFYSEALQSRKAQKLKPNMFKHWVNLLCLANVQEERGTLPPIPDIAYAMRLTEEMTGDVIEELVTLLFIDAIGDGYEMHDWEDWQKDRDVAPAQRASKRDVSVINVTETPRIQRTTRDVSVTRGEGDKEEEIDKEQEEEEEIEGEGLLPFEPSSSRSKSWDDVDLVVPSLIEDFPGLDVNRELGKAKDWLKANGKRKKDHVSYFRNWLRRAEEYGNDRRAQPEQRRPVAEPSPFAYLGAKVP